MIDQIIKYEQGELDTRETVELFGTLVQTGQAWTLQGHYGRTAKHLIELGVLGQDGTVHTDMLDEQL